MCYYFVPALIKVGCIHQCNLHQTSSQDKHRNKELGMNVTHGSWGILLQVKGQSGIVHFNIRKHSPPTL